MGDITSLFASLNLSPVNSVLLAALYFFVKKLFDRLDELEGEEGPLRRIEEILYAHRVDIARIKDKVKMEE